MQNRVFVLTYHSQNVLGMTYASNDHVALAQDLRLIRELGLRVISALELATALRRGSFPALPDRCVVITMDDGCVFDCEDIVHPRHGPQQSMLSILRQGHTGSWGLRLGRPPFVATAFVIGSKPAREQISSLSFGNTEWMADRWWSAAQRTPYLDVGCHSWNHVHPYVREMADRPDLVGAFHRIECAADADLQIAHASRQLYAVTKSEAARLFAYPYGRTNEFLVREYLPRQKSVIAAFTTAAEPVTRYTGIWQIPRYVCGHNWKSVDDLRRLLCGNS